MGQYPTRTSQRCQLLIMSKKKSSKAALVALVELSSRLKKLLSEIEADIELDITIISELSIEREIKLKEFFSEFTTEQFSEEITLLNELTAIDVDLVRLGESKKLLIGQQLSSQQNKKRINSVYKSIK